MFDTTHIFFHVCDIIYTIVIMIEVTIINFEDDDITVTSIISMLL